MIDFGSAGDVFGEEVLEGNFWRKMTVALSILLLSITICRHFHILRAIIL